MSENIYMQIDQVNESEGYRFGQDDPFESFTSEAGELFRDCQREYGQCKGKVYIDRDNSAIAIGWVFERLSRYEDTREKFLLSTWVTLHKSLPTRTIEYDYIEL